MKRECASVLQDGPGPTVKRCVPTDSTDQTAAKSAVAKTTPSAGRTTDSASAFPVGWEIDATRYVRKASTAITAWNRATAPVPVTSCVTQLMDAFAVADTLEKSATNRLQKQRSTRKMMPRMPDWLGVWYWP